MGDVKIVYKNPDWRLEIRDVATNVLTVKFYTAVIVKYVGLTSYMNYRDNPGKFVMPMYDPNDLNDLEEHVRRLLLASMLISLNRRGGGENELNTIQHVRESGNAKFYAAAVAQNHSEHF